MEHKKDKKRKVARPDEGDSLEVIAEKFQKFLNAPKELKRPPGTITSSEYAELTNTNSKTVAEWLRRLYRGGKIERFRVGSFNYYRIPSDVRQEEAENE